MSRPEVKFSEWIEKGFDLYKQNAGVLILASLIVFLLSMVTFGLLSGPLMVGLILVVLRLASGEEPKPKAGDVFQGFSYFLDALLFILVWGVIITVIATVLGLIPCVGQLLVIFISWAASALLMFALYLIADKKQAFWPASMASIDLVKTNFWPFLGFAIVAGLIGSIGAILCLIGVVLTLPIQTCMVAVAYRDLFGEGSAPAPAAEEIPAEDVTVTPPPGSEDASAAKETPGPDAASGEQEQPPAGA